MFSEPHRPLEEERCPVSDQFLAELHRSTPCQVDLMIATVDPYVRTMLALYCYRRAHLFNVGLTVASACDEHGPRPRLDSKSSGRPKITLATGRLRTMGSLEDDEVADANN